MSSLSTPGSHDLSRAAVGRSSPPEVTVWRSLAELPIVAKPTLPLGLAPVNLLKAVVVKFTPGGFGSVFATTVSVLDQPASQEVLKDWQATSGEAIEQTKEEARGAMDNYFDFLHKAIASIPTGGTQLGEKLKSYSEENIAVARDYMRKLSQAKDFTEVAQIQLDFAHAQFNAFSGQAKGLSEAYTKTAADAVNKPFKKVA